MRREAVGEKSPKLLKSRRHALALVPRSPCLMPGRGAEEKDRGRLPPSQRPLPCQSRVEVALQPPERPAPGFSSRALAGDRRGTDLVPLQKENPGEGRGSGARLGVGGGGG